MMIDGSKTYSITLGWGWLVIKVLILHRTKPLTESSTNGVDVFLFEVFEKGKYIYIGQVGLADEPYQEVQPDIHESLRKVWVFPLKVVGNKPVVPIPSEVLSRKQKRQRQRARNLSIQELMERVKHSKPRPSSRKVTTTVNDRNENLAALVKQLANGICQLCNQLAPFKDKRGDPYLECHHIVWLSKGGEDTIENTRAVCPNCHRKMHSLNLKSDINKLKRIEMAI